MLDLIQWIKSNHPAEFAVIKKQYKNIEIQSSVEITAALERYLFDNYSMLIERSGHGFRIFWETKGMFISGRYQFMDMVLKEALDLTRWKPLKMISSFFLLSFLV